jgi:predicted dithiol-disulfide oxidoreductase (DUF899 family)
MGWRFPWVSPAHTDFTFDLGFSSSEEQTRGVRADAQGWDAANRRAQSRLDGHRHPLVTSRQSLRARQIRLSLSQTLAGPIETYSNGVRHV